MQPNQSLQLPEPILFSEEGSFAQFTFFHRFPSIIQQAIRNNNFPAEVVNNLETLSHELNQGTIRELNDQGSDLPAWNEFLKPYLGKPWIELPFFLGEVYFYRRIIEAIGYFEYSPNERPDPYAVPKQESLQKVLETEQQAISELEANSKDILIELLYASLWGNREDLSQLFTSQPESDEMTNLEAQRSSVIVDDTAVVAGKLADYRDARIDLIADNAGSELLRDLYLIDFLLSRQIAGVVHLHLKSHPTFVSDATVRDFRITVEQLAHHPSEAFQSLASRLKQYMNSDQLRLREDFFWTMPQFLWNMDQRLRDHFSKLDLAIFKGDANYRRLVGDLHWEHTIPFDKIVSYFPSPLAVLRTLKSELMVGLTPGETENLQTQDPNWLTNGRWGAIQSQGIS
ncbi:MAG: damage-control phosphatase ARMT1 family protein [Halothece sp.]